MCNIDLENRIIKVDHALIVIPTFDKFGRKIKRESFISNTKTSSSVREVPIPSILLKALEDWKKIRLDQERKTGLSLTASTDIVFSNNKGKVRNYYGLRTMFKKLMKNSEIAKYNIHFHSLRHTYATILFENGENPKVIQMLLGHKDVTTTLKIYNSIDRSYFSQAVDKINKVFPVE